MKKNLIEEEIHLGNVLESIENRMGLLAKNKPFSNVSKYSVANDYNEIDDLRYKKGHNEKVEEEITYLNSFIDEPYLQD